MSRLKTGFYLDLSTSEKTKLASGDQIHFDTKLGTVQFKRGDTNLFYYVGPEKDNRFVFQIDSVEVPVFVKIIATAMGMGFKRLKTNREDLIIYEFV